MKTDTIKQQILTGYNKITQLAAEKTSQKNVVPIWGITYTKNHTSGFVGQLGLIERGGSSIRIVNGDVVQLHKPFFSTWKGTLKKINKMLQNTIANLENKDVVTKNVLNIFCFSENAVKKL